MLLFYLFISLEKDNCEFSHLLLSTFQECSIFAAIFKNVDIGYSSNG